MELEQMEIFGTKYTPEEIEDLKDQLANDVVDLEGARAEKAETVRSYNDAIKDLEERIAHKAKVIRQARIESGRIGMAV